MLIEVHHSYMNRTQGLCGLFDGKSNNDRMGSDGLVKSTLIEMAQSWNEEAGDCRVEFPHRPYCVEVKNIVHIDHYRLCLP